ncbi:MAG: hypothetical protein AVDCRST_MAG70-944 [uncultured Thermomicrobiales bacterium]|uniref:Methyltransferase type 11 domain-containing protein n=1 Tax=uncultured Thermomicrobiales bacterium TaxID=1645740 RepID=A0A6J4UMF7_9BACT|nr:MAG: hypothetical protein AVDCRST_MAG70-944 [uncultured Thermomicrobiales bacterium]
MPHQDRDAGRSVEEAWRAMSQATWDERAAWWEEISEAQRRGGEVLAGAEGAIRGLALQPGHRLLDAGCGTGQYAVAFAAWGARVDAVDLSPAMINRARAHAAASGLDISFHVADLARLPFPEATFDAVQARLSLHFAFDLPATLRELGRVLRPEGRLYASVPGPLSPISANVWQRHLDPGRRANNYVTPWELEALLGHLGWEVTAHLPHFGPSPDGAAPTFDPSVIEGSHLPMALQQAAATTWAMIANHPHRPLTNPADDRPGP